MASIRQCVPRYIQIWRVTDWELLSANPARIGLAEHFARGLKPMLFVHADETLKHDAAFCEQAIKQSGRAIIHFLPQHMLRDTRDGYVHCNWES